MAANYFLKFEPSDGVEGESSQQDHEDEIEILSYSWGVSQAGGFSFGGGGGVSRANVQDLSVSFRMCKASPQLMEHCATGKHLDSATLTCLKAAGDKQEKYLEIIMTDVVISSYQTGGSGDDMPIESMSLNFAEIEEKYFEQDDTGGTTEAGTGRWNQLTATA